MQQIFSHNNANSKFLGFLGYRGSFVAVHMLLKHESSQRFYENKQEGLWSTKTFLVIKGGGGLDLASKATVCQPLF